MRKLPTPRSKIYNLYWYFASERQAIFEKRARGEPAPWTNDPILQRFKFCSVYRAADRVSQYLIKDITYSPAKTTPEDLLFQIIAFRLFSKIETWKEVKKFLGHAPTLNDLYSNLFTKALEKAREVNKTLYTAAFILSAGKSYNQKAKYLNHVELLKDMFLKGQLGKRLLGTKSLQEIYDLIHHYPLMGDFMSYQIAIDLNYSDLINFSENEFTKAGPGAERGIKKAFLDLGDFTPEEVIFQMVKNQAKEFKRLGLKFGGLYGRPLQAIDCQGLFCELDKYCREAEPKLLSNRARIKTPFRSTPNPINYIFPPKWGLKEASALRFR